MYRHFSVLVALVVLLAGCVGTTPGGTDTPTAGPPSTPTPTAVDTSTPLPSGKLAPGITADGIENVTALLAAHQRELTASGFVSEASSRTLAEGVESTRVAWTVTVSPGGDRARTHAIESREDGSQVVVDIWSNATHDTTRRDEDGTVTYAVSPRSITDDTIVWSGNGAHVLVSASAEAFEVETVETRDGLRYVTLVAEENGAREDGLPASRATLVVDELGRIHELERHIQYTESVAFTTTYRVVQLGDTDPQPPTWLETV
jgi:hypothetical protein